jgi:hypothetical protein
MQRFNTAPKSFDLGDVLTISTGFMVAASGINAVYEMLNFMTNDSLFTHQLPRAMKECQPYLVRQYPFLGSPELAAAVLELEKEMAAPNLSGEERRIQCMQWVALQKERYGSSLMIEPIPADDHTRVKDPAAELGKMLGPGKVIQVNLPDKR